MDPGTTPARRGFGWTTTWEHYANEVLGPLLGLPKLLLAIAFHAEVTSGHHHSRMDGVRHDGLEA